MVKVLIADKMDPLAEETFKKLGVEVDFKPGMPPEELKKVISNYDGMAVRSSTKVTPEILDAAKNLKVVGRAGIGVDNIDVKHATEKGVVVMNTPFGNSITTAEHAIAMMFALARDIPQASASTHAGKWEKSKFMGTELYGKTLGVVGCGNIGSIVANRALGLKMRVVAYDPFLNTEKAQEMGIEKAELDDVLKQADFVTIHVPKNEKTVNLINKDTIAKMKAGSYLINCARGGLIDEAALKDALDSGHIAGAGLDVFAEEPAKENILFGHENVICTPHLGASTAEAQVNVALQVAEQISDYLLNGAVTNALNMPSISAEEAPKLRPYMALSRELGQFAGQITQEAVKSIHIEYSGLVSALKTQPLTAMMVANLLACQMDSVNNVNAFAVAESRGITIKETHNESQQNWRSAVNIDVETETSTFNVRGTLFTDGTPRIINIDGVPIEAVVSANMLFIRNEDKPGLIGALGTLLGEKGYNIADFRLGRVPETNNAVALIGLDDCVDGATIKEIHKLPQIRAVIALKF